jgi:hypothetical protein
MNRDEQYIGQRLRRGRCGGKRGAEQFAGQSDGTHTSTLTREEKLARERLVESIVAGTSPDT